MRRSPTGLGSEEPLTNRLPEADLGGEPFTRQSALGTSLLAAMATDLRGAGAAMDR